MKITRWIPAIALAAVVTLTGCTNTEGTEGRGGDAATDVTVDKAAAALLPDDVKESGELLIGSSLGYPPNDFLTADGTPTGWSVNLISAVAEKLGLEPKFEKTPFASIIPKVQEGTQSSRQVRKGEERQAKHAPEKQV